jgi:hypothetical protein
VLARVEAQSTGECVMGLRQLAQDMEQRGCGWTAKGCEGLSLREVCKVLLVSRGLQSPSWAPLFCYRWT